MSRQWAQKKSSSNSSMSVQKSSSSQRPFTAPVYDPPAPKQTPSVQAKRRNVDWNRVTVEAQSPAGVQAKLSVGAPGDKYEQEADAMANKVMTMPAPENEKPLQREMAPEEKEEEVQTKPLADSIQREMVPEEKEEEVQTKPLADSIQREMAPEEKEEEVQTKPLANSIQREMVPEEKEEEVQTKPLANSIQREMVPEEKEEEVQTKPLANSIQREMAPEEKEEEVQTKPATEGKSQAGSNLESQLSGTKGGGSALSDEVRSHMEPRFGADFSSVRVHTDSAAVQMNRDLGAQAFTHGSDIYYGGGKSPGKDELTAHELTHVVQQNGGAVQRAPLIQRTGGKQDTDEDDIQSVPAGDIKGKKQTHEDDIQPVPAGDINGKKKQTVETSEVPTDFDYLLRGIEKGAEEEIVKKLLSNFYARTDFTYTGSSKTGWTHEGDCSTLVSQFINIATQKYGIENMGSNKQEGPLFIKGGGKIIDQESKTGNVDRGLHWRFDNHVWAEWNGQKIDVLFGQMGLKPSEKVVQDSDGTFTAGGKTYYLAKDAVRSKTNAYTSYIEDRYDFANLNGAPRPRPKNRFGTCTIM